jgi:hypothetical protein
MLARAAALETDKDTRDFGIVGDVPSVEDTLAGILNDPESIAEILADMDGLYPAKTFLDDFAERVWDLNIPVTETGTPRFNVADVYGDKYEGTDWFETMSNTESGLFVPEVVVNVTYPDYEELMSDFNDDGAQLTFDEIAD